ncbi:hypothetical protein WCLP8_5380003 [uncultured Gammaproteobacteria bacterium]
MGLRAAVLLVEVESWHNAEMVPLISAGSVAELMVQRYLWH